MAGWETIVFLLGPGLFSDATVDERNLDQLRLVVYPIIYSFFFTPRVVVWDFFHQPYVNFTEGNCKPHDHY